VAVSVTPAEGVGPPPTAAPAAAAAPGGRVADPTRLEALRAADLLDTPAEEAFDRLTRLATRLLNVPVALVTVVDRDRQFFKSCVGLPEPWATKRETPLTHSFCQYTVETGEPLIVEDARTHPLVRANLAVPELNVVAYAGVPLVVGGQVLATFCAIDTKPRHWPPADVAALEDLARAAATEIELRLALRDAESERRERRAIVDSTVEGIYSVDGDGNCTFANQAAADLLGYQPSEMVGWNMHALIHHSRPDGSPYPEVECPLYNAFRRGSRVVLDSEVFFRRDGSSFAVDCASAPIVDGGTVIGAVVAFSDSTDRRRAERGLRFLADASATLVSTLDYESALRQVARLAVPTLADACVVEVVDGGREELAVAHADPELEPLLREARERYGVAGGSTRSTIERVLATGRPEVAEVTDEVRRAAARDDEHYALLSRLAICRALHVPLIAHGRALGVMTLVSTARQFSSHDISLAEELARRAATAIDNARLYREAQRATRARDDVLGIVSHDLRNPIHAIYMAGSFLLELLPPTPEGKKESIERSQARVIRRSAERANRMIQDLLDVTRLSAGTLALEMRIHTASSLLAEAVESSRSAAAEAGVTLEARADDGLEVCADRDRVLQILSNLLGNALKFTPRGGTVRMTAEPDAAADGGGRVRFAVRDTGPGIPAAHLPHLFDRYWQANRADRRGVGLGLSIAKGIAEAHGGRIWVETAEGKGSTFYFTVPKAG